MIVLAAPLPVSVTLLVIDSAPPVSRISLPLSDPSNVIMSESAFAFADVIASRKLTKPSFASTTSDTVVTVNAASTNLDSNTSAARFHPTPNRRAVFRGDRPRPDLENARRTNSAKTNVSWKCSFSVEDLCQAGRHRDPAMSQPQDYENATRRHSAQRWVRHLDCDIWTAATGVAAFQNAPIPPRVLNRKSPAETSRFEKRWFRPPHSKCLNFDSSVRIPRTFGVYGNCFS